MKQTEKADYLAENEALKKVAQTANYFCRALIFFMVNPFFKEGLRLLAEEHTGKLGPAMSKLAYEKYEGLDKMYDLLTEEIEEYQLEFSFLEYDEKWFDEFEAKKE